MVKYILAALIVILETYSLIMNSDIFSGKIRFGFFGYYTNLSNILVWIYFILVLFNVSPFNDNVVIAISVTLAITLTFLIYHFILSPDIVAKHKAKTLGWNAFSIENISVHYICPILTLIYFFLCVDKTNLVVWQSLYWLILPFVYFFYILIRAKLNIAIEPDGHKYPYDFMDIDTIGVKKVAINIAVLFVVFAILGLIVGQVSIWLR